MLAYDENGKIDEFEENYGLKVCKQCHRIYQSYVEEQIPGFREKEDDMCPYCGHVNRQSMSYDFCNSEVSPDNVAKLERKSLIKTVMEFCNRAYLKSSCDRCNHFQGCPNKACLENCKVCLEEIHYPSRNPLGKKDYDCDRLLNFYVCDYSMKYASEMLYLMRQSDILKSIDHYNVLSLGCGGCPDLMALERFCHEQSFCKTIKYAGIDINPMWKSIHDVISSYRSTTIIDTKFNYIDAVQVPALRGTNVIIIQYLVSRIYNQTNGNQILDHLFDNIISNIVIPNLGNPIVILINDVNSNKMGRDYCDKLVNKLANKNIHWNAYKFYFDSDDLNDYQRIGAKQRSRDNLFADVLKDMENSNKFIHTYEPWQYCKSFQLLLEINP